MVRPYNEEKRDRNSQSWNGNHKRKGLEKDLGKG